MLPEYLNYLRSYELYNKTIKVLLFAFIRCIGDKWSHVRQSFICRKHNITMSMLWYSKNTQLLALPFDWRSFWASSVVPVDDPDRPSSNPTTQIYFLPTLTPPLPLLWLIANLFLLIRSTARVFAPSFSFPPARGYRQVKHPKKPMTNNDVVRQPSVLKRRRHTPCFWIF